MSNTNAARANFRDPLIDIFRGLAVLGVLSIHTAFWSGMSYVPVWFASLTLLLDVPMFFFVSGWGSGLKRMGDIIRQLNGLWKNFFGKAVLFVIIMVLVSPLLGLKDIENFEELLKNFAFAFSFDTFFVLPGSLWYVPYYLRTVIVNGFLICCIKPHLENIGYKEVDIIKSLLTLNVVLFLMSCGGANYLPFGLGQMDYFYNIMWLFGAYIAQRGIKIKSIITCTVLVFINILCFLLFAKALELDILVVQNMKFPTKPSAMLPWLFYSFITIIPVLYIRSKTVGDFRIIRALKHIGKNSIFYFFAQGISSSIIYNFLHWSISAWWLRFAIMYSINVFFSVVIAESFVFCDKLVKKQITKIQQLGWISNF